MHCPRLDWRGSIIFSVVVFFFIFVINRLVGLQVLSCMPGILSVVSTLSSTTVMKGERSWSMGLAIFVLISLEEGEISGSTVVTVDVPCRYNQILLKCSKRLTLIIIISGLVESS